MTIQNVPIMVSAVSGNVNVQERIYTTGAPISLVIVNIRPHKVMYKVTMENCNIDSLILAMI